MLWKKGFLEIQRMVFAKIFSNLYFFKMNKIGVKKIISEFHLDLTQHDIKSFLGKQCMTTSGVYFLKEWVPMNCNNTSECLPESDIKFKEFTFVTNFIYSLLNLQVWYAFIDDTPAVHENMSNTEIKYLRSRRWNWGWEKTLSWTEVEKKKIFLALHCRELNQVIKYVTKDIKMGALTSALTSYYVLKKENFIVRHFPNSSYLH